MRFDIRQIIIGFIYTSLVTINSFNGSCQRIYRTTEYYNGKAFHITEFDTLGRPSLEIQREVELPIYSPNRTHLTRYQKSGNDTDQVWLNVRGYLDAEGKIQFQSHPTLEFFKYDSLINRSFSETFWFEIPDESIEITLGNVWSIKDFPIFTYQARPLLCAETLVNNTFRRYYRYYNDENKTEYHVNFENNGKGIKTRTQSYRNGKVVSSTTIEKSTYSRRITETKEFLTKPEIVVKDTYKDLENRIIKEVSFLPISGKLKKDKQLKPELTLLREYLGNKVIRKTYLINQKEYEVTVVNTYYPND